MLKRALCFLFTLIMTTSIFLCSAFCAYGEELTEGVFPEETAETDNTAETADLAEETTENVPPEATFSTARFPALSVSVISNYFGRIDADYNEYTEEFTIKFFLKSAKSVLSTHWTLSYDSSILKLDHSKNSKQSVCPIMNNSSIISFDDKKGIVEFNATDLRMYDLSNNEVEFAKLVFSIPKLTADDSETTKVDLTVNELWVSDPDPKTGLSVPSNEICLVSKSNMIKNKRANAVSVIKNTFISASTFNEDNIYVSTNDQAVVTTVKPTEQTTVSTAPNPQPAPPKKPAAKKTEQANAVNTGEWYIALLILGMLFVCSTILLVLRKRDIYND